MSVELRCSETDQSKRDIPSFIESRPPLYLNPFMRPRPQKGVNLLEMFEEDSVSDEPEWVKVYLRLKPCEQPNMMYEVKNDRHFITSMDTTTAGHGRRTLHNVSKMYTFSRIFGPETSQKEIFDKVVKDNLKKLPEGHNFTLLTYGASGSGKTYTLMGTVSAPGLVPRSLEYVFKVVEAAQQPLYKPADNGAEQLNYYQQECELKVVKRLRNVSTSFHDKYRRASTQVINDLTASTFDLSNRTKYYVWVSFVEIYNEKIYDLLSYSDRNKTSSNLQIREDSNGNVFVKGATQAFVRSGAEAYDIMVAAKYNLQVAATGIHAHSSRSHCIFTITMLTEKESTVRSSYVRLCDLAGCERLRQTRNTGARMVESRAINSSLHVLERCLRMLKRKQRRAEDATIVPYRESKLTRLLGAGLSGLRNEAVTMVVALNPAPHCAQLNRHVLQLATVAKDIQVNSTIAETILESSGTDTTSGGGDNELRYELMCLREENDRLHFQLARAQSCIRELQDTIDAKQLESANTMREIAEEAKDIIRQYYEGQIQSLRAQMEEMREDYENQLQTLKNQDPNVSNVSRFSTEFGTPSRHLRQKNKQLETVLALKEEQLEDKRDECTRLEAEVQRLLACIEERDARATPDIEVLSSEESEDENQSLELTVKKKDVNGSILQSQMNNVTLAEVDESDNEQLEVTYKDIEADISHDRTSDSSNVKENTTEQKLTFENFDLNESLRLTINSDDKQCVVRETYLVRNDEDESLQIPINSDDNQCTTVRGTYFVRMDEGYNTNTNESYESLKSYTSGISNRGTYFVNKEEPNKSHVLETIGKPQTESYFFTKLNENSYSNDKLLASAKKLVACEKETKSSFSVDESDVSLAQFEQLEKYTEDEVKINNHEIRGIVLLNKSSTKQVKDSADNISNVILLGDDRSPSIVKEKVTDDFEPIKIRTILGESFTRPNNIVSTMLVNNKIALSKKNASVDIFELFDSPNVSKPQGKIPEKIVGNLEISKDNSNGCLAVTEKSVLDKTPGKHRTHNIGETNNITDTKDDIVSELTQKEYSNKTNDQIIKKHFETEKNTSILDIAVEKSKEKPSTKLKSDSQKVVHEFIKPININKQEIGLSQIDVTKTHKTNEKHEHSDTVVNNTTVEFEKLYENVTVPNASAFDQLVLDENNVSVHKSGIDKNVSYKQSEKIKYNLRHNHKGNNDSLNKKDQSKDEVLLESEAKCGQKAPKRNLRLRRRPKITDYEKNEERDEISKLKDIVNLQNEYCDVTLDKPAPKKKVVEDIPSPEKTDEQENVPSTQDTQSCIKSVTRSRRKLFTPRPEPMEDSPEEDAGGAGGDSGGRVRVPRPSYHRGRARRKL